jgi:hypothetical protein
MAKFVWWTLMSAAVLISLWGLAADIWLINNNGQSMSDYLRRHPWAFWGPLILLAAAVLSLAIHLFVHAMNNGD